MQVETYPAKIAALLEGPVHDVVNGAFRAAATAAAHCVSRDTLVLP